MLGEIKWKDVYRRWEYGSYYFPKILTAPVSVDRVFVKYEKKDSYFYGYDWMDSWDAAATKKSILEDPAGFICFSKPPDQGIIHTAQMLVESQSQEERAAIWIAATSKELERYQGNKDLWRYACQLCIAACEFLRDRYFLWHYPMKKTLPAMLIPFSILDSTVCKSIDPIIGLIQMNTMMLRTSWTILLYSSLEKGELPDVSCRIRDL